MRDRVLGAVGKNQLFLWTKFMLQLMLQPFPRDNTEELGEQPPTTDPQNFRRQWFDGAVCATSKISCGPYLCAAISFGFIFAPQISHSSKRFTHSAEWAFSSDRFSFSPQPSGQGTG